MSASLVGSEMCIRDSPSTARVSGVAPPWRARPHTAATRNPCKREKKPVSYTHLTLPTICSV
eukprot:8004171-Alexandrium_andersonii.AAC.1